ncbi:MAG: GAF domain-containing sensor histidine kinase, partial [Myxococcota bacterium]|nr:GAF domain-containing sensor histidine kinase [Myxococcota bacterium]
MLPGRHLSVLRDVTAQHRTDTSLRFLAEASKTLAASLDHETTFRNVARLAVPALADWAVIDVARDDGSLQRVAVEHVDPQKVAVAHELHRKRPLHADDPFGPPRVIRTGEPEVTFEVTDAQIDASVPDREMREMLRSLGLRSTICVPLRTRDRIVGALSLVFSDSGRRYVPADVELAEELARRIAVALDNARLYADAQSARAVANAATRRAELLAEASRLLETMQDGDATLTATARFVVPELADWCFADRLDDDGELRRVAVFHADPADADLAARIGLHSSRSAASLDDVGLLRSNEPTLFAEIDDGLLQRLARDDAHLAALRELAPRAALTLPLVARGHIFGTLLLARSRDPRPFTEEDLALSEELARRVAIAADNARLYRAMQKAEERARFLAEASMVLASSLDFETVLPNIARLVVPTIADAAGVYTVTVDGGIRQVAIAHRDPEREALIWEMHALSPLHVEQDRVLPTVIRTGRSQLLSDIPPTIQSGWGGADRVREIVALLDLRSYMAVPIAVRGRVLGAIALSSSTSERRFDETDLALAEELARRLASALENAQLYAEAREASRLKDEFLATISHELRTPLNAILGWASILPSRATSPEAFQRGLAVIERNARAQARLIDDVLDVSRIVSGKLGLRRERVDVGAVIRAAAESLAPSAGAARIDLQVDVAPDVGSIVGDPDRIQQIVWNLLSNAVKFTPAGGHITARATRGSEHVEIRVQDDGAGIAPEFLPFVFDRFRQADSSMTRRHGGLGLGLSIARHLTELHGGEIDVESPGIGMGATFRVVLPARGAPAPLDEALASTTPAPRPTSPRLEGVRVLVCDD